MAAGQMALDVLVRLRDLMSGPLRRLSGTVRGFTSLAGRIGVVGAAIAGISFVAPIAGAAEFQQSLIDMALTAERTGSDAFLFTDQWKKRVEDLALATGLASSTILAGSNRMLAAGLDEKLIDGSLDTIAKVTRAANANFNDMADVATSALMTLGVPISEIEQGLAEMMMAGKLGAFELADMAQYFPSLTSKMNKLGENGLGAMRRLAAMLEICLLYTSPSPRD